MIDCTDNDNDALMIDESDSDGVDIITATYLSIIYLSTYLPTYLCTYLPTDRPTDLPI